MSLDIGSALSEGFSKLTTRAGLLLVAIYALVNLLTTGAYNTIMVGLVSSDVAAQVGYTYPVSTAVAGGIAFVGLVAGLVLSLVILRTVAHDASDLGSIPNDVTDNLVVATVFLFITNIVVGVLVFVGTLLLVIPGLFLAVSLIFAQVFVAVEGEGPFESLSSSWALAKGNRFSLFALGLVFVVIAVIVSLLGGVFGIVSQLLGTVVSTIVTSFFAVFGPAVILAAYHQLTAAEQRSTEDDSPGALGADDLGSGP